MASHTFPLYRHWVGLGRQLDVPYQGRSVAARGCLVAQGEGGYTVQIYFVDDGAEQPDGSWDEARLAATWFYRLSEMDRVLHVFATSPALYAYVDADRPLACMVQTTQSPQAEDLVR